LKKGDGLEEIDEDFNWLVLILGTLAETLVGSIHLFPLAVPPLTPKIEIQFLKLPFVPMIVRRDKVNKLHASRKI
jgi:hypothetical protein